MATPMPGMTLRLPGGKTVKAAAMTEGIMRLPWKPCDARRTITSSIDPDPAYQAGSREPAGGHREREPREHHPARTSANWIMMTSAMR